LLYIEIKLINSVTVNTFHKSQCML